MSETELDEALTHLQDAVDRRRKLKYARSVADLTALRRTSEDIRVHWAELQRLNMSLTRVADRVGMTREQLSNIVHGHVKN